MKMPALAALSIALAPTVATASYQSVYTQARQDYGAGRYRAAYTALRAYRAGNAGTFAMDDLFAISACALPDLRASGLGLLKLLVQTYHPNAADAAKVQQQIAICGRSNGPIINVALLGAGGGSTSIPTVTQILGAGSGSTSIPTQPALRAELLQRSQKLGATIDRMPALQRGAMPH